MTVGLNDDFIVDPLLLHDDILVKSPVYLHIANISQVPSNIAGDNYLVYNQTTALATWTINHVLGRYPAVTVIDVNGFAIIADVEYPNISTVVITHAFPLAGKALLT